MDRNRLHEFRSSVERELEGNILPFWKRYAADEERGGFVAEMSNGRHVRCDAAKGLILNARLLWTFAAVYRASRDEECLALAQRAYDYLETYFWDTEFGGALWNVDGEGNLLDGKKKIYGQAFMIYALSEFYLATQNQEAKERALEFFELIERRAHDDEHGGYIETCNRDWTIAEDNRLSAIDMDEKKSMNNHLHVLEAYTNLYRIEPCEWVAERLEELIDLFFDKIIDPSAWHFNHFFDMDWRVKSDTNTYGHDIEGSWLFYEAAEVLLGEHIPDAIRLCVLELARTVVEEGFDADGGLLYEGRSGEAIDTDKVWWPQAEAVVGSINAYQLSGDERYLDVAWNCWRFIESAIVDRTHGEWFWQVSRDGVPDGNEPKISEWKGPYHNVRCCLETMRRLDNILGEQSC